MTSDAPYVLELPGDNGKLTFRTRGELQAHFLRMQQTFESAANGTQAYSEFLTNIVHPYRQWANDPTPMQQGDYDGAANYFKQEFKRWFTPESGRGSLVLRLKDLHGKEVSAVAFAVLCNSQPGPTTGVQFLGIVAASNYLLGHPFGEVEARKHWEKLNIDVDAWFRQSREDIEASRKSDADERKLAHDEMARLRNECKEAIDQAKQQANQLVAVTTMDVGSLYKDQKARLDESVHATKETLAALEKTYNQKLALQKPMEYWRAKEQEHRDGLKKWGWIFCVSAVLCAAAFFWFVHDQLPADVSIQHIPLNKIAQVAVLVTIGLWLLRMLARNYIMHLHLANDARERCVMVSTYLSMSSAGGISDEGRNLVMASIFRKASTGIVKEDAAPPTIIPMIRGGGE